MQTWIKRSSLFAVFLFLMSFTAYGQDNASMTGVVTDSTGASVVGARVVLLNPSRGIDANVKTDKDGSYRFPNVPPAPGYKVTFSHEGFAPLTIDGIDLLVGITRTQNGKLSAGSTQAVEVVATNSVVSLNTTDASIGNNIDIEMVNDLPIQSRNSPTALFTLEPGVTYSGSVTGARTDQTSITVDGMDVNDISTGGFTSLSSPTSPWTRHRSSVAQLPG